MTTKTNAPKLLPAEMVTNIVNAMHTAGVAVSGGYNDDGDKSFAEALDKAIDIEDDDIRNLIKDLAREVRALRQGRARIRKAWEEAVMLLRPVVTSLQQEMR